jgi:hypothetical protein
MTTYALLRDTFLADTSGGRSAAPALARSLELLGWHAVQESSPEELASHLVFMLDDCVHDHRDLDVLARAIAGLLRDHGPFLDGGLPPMEAYLPAAEELLRLYTR